MAGGLMQLVAYGAQDLYLTGNPQMTFFKMVYKRYTNFSMEYIRQDFNKKPSFNETNTTTLTAKIGRNGDLVGDMYVVFDLPRIFSSTVDNFKWVKNIAHIFIKSVELIIGGQVIDRQTGIWNNVWNQLSPYNKTSYKRMTGDVVPFYAPYPYYGSLNQNGIQTIDDPLPGQSVYPSIRGRRVYLPLEFWFCKEPGSFLPLIALQYHEISVRVEFRPLNEIFTIGSPPISPVKLFSNPTTPGDGKSNYQELLTLLDGEWSDKNIFWRYVNGTTDPGVWNQNAYLDVNYIFLDDDERRKFAKSPHSYLIKQVQHRVFGGLSGPERLKLELQHPISELIWVFQRDDVSLTNRWTNYTNFINPTDIPNVRTLRDCLNCLKNLDCAACPVDDNEYNELRPITLKSGLTVEELWTLINNDDANNTSFNDINAFDLENNIMYTAKLLLNGHERMSEKDVIFFDSLQKYKYHSNDPTADTQSVGIYLYSFALYADDFKQPSGTLNMSRVNNAIFEVVLREPPNSNNVVSVSDENDNSVETLNGGDKLKYNMLLFATNYNILRIRSGMAGLAFAN